MPEVNIVTITTDQLEDMFRRAFIYARSQEQRVLTKAELAEFLRVSEPTINRWMLKGMPYLGGGRPRYEKNAVLGWLESHPDV